MGESNLGLHAKKGGGPALSPMLQSLHRGLCVVFLSAFFSIVSFNQVEIHNTLILHIILQGY